jgi:hypothetical protein
MLYDNCPQCGEPVNPPIPSIRRQVCYSCGWSGEEVEIVSPPKSESENSIVAKLKSKGFRRWGIIIGLSLVLLAGATYCHNEREKRLASERVRKEIDVALAAIEKIDSSLEVGINITEYERLVLDAKYPLDALAELDTDSVNARAIESVNRAFSGYLLGLRWWRCKIKGWRDQEDVRCWDDLLPELFAYSDLLERVIRPKLTSDPIRPQTTDLNGSGVLQLIWEEAGLGLSEARSALVLEK